MTFSTFCGRRFGSLVGGIVGLATLVLSLCPVRGHAEATGFIHVEQIDGVWWFIDPDGEKFISTGVNHIEPHLWLAPYNKAATLAKYGDDMVDENGYFSSAGSAAKKWINAQVAVCEDLHFNTFAKHTHEAINPKLYAEQIYYVISLETASLAGWRERKGEGPRPDVFSADFAKFVDEKVRGICEQHRESRNLLGYLYTDVPSWIMGMAERRERDNFVMIYPWLNSIIGLGESAPGKQRWIAHLAERYDRPEDAAKVWGFEVSPTYGISWERMARLTTWFDPVDAEKADADMKSFMFVIADQWYGMHREIVHRYDQNHLVFGDKNIVNWHYPWVLAALKKHVDVVATQGYGRWADDGPITADIYAATGKPIFNGDGCFGLANEHQQEWGVKGFRTGAKSMADVAAFYEETLRGMMADPHMIGWHHCGYIEQWDAAERGDSPRNENGFLTPFEEYHTEWTDVIRRVNAAAPSWHETSR
ncbi:MAG: hypothetical protein SynsKO_27290 [Synoicihabitans sp.]